MRPFLCLVLAAALAAPAWAEPNEAQLVVEGENILSLTLEGPSGRITVLEAREGAEYSILRSGNSGRGSQPMRIRLPQDGGTVSLPPGRYRWNTVIVAEANSPVRFSAQNSSMNTLQLLPGRTTTLNVGGPLRPQLGVTRSGPTLLCTSRLLGIGGETYRPMPPVGGTSTPTPKGPDLSITGRGQVIHTGTFSYG